MKSFLLAAILGVTLLTPAMARADASEQGCKSSGEKADGCGKGSKEWGKGWWKDKDNEDAPPFQSRELEFLWVRVYWLWAASCCSGENAKQIKPNQR